MLIETQRKRMLSSMMRSLGISTARRLNRLMGTRGRVIAQRYHARALRTPAEVRHARHYVLSNHAHHFGETSAIDPFSSAAWGMTPAPKTWLLAVGWQKSRVPG
jgi:hypothetical protein